MGNCCGLHSHSATSYPVKRSADATYQATRPTRGGNSENGQRLVLKLLAEVNTLSSDDGPLRWQPLFHSLVPLCLHCVQEGDVYVYKVSAVGVDGFKFSTLIKVPGTKIRKTSKCFVQWRDTDKGGAWGLNFMSEADAIQFLNGCSPPSVTPLRLRHALSTLSLSLPIPSPPSGCSVLAETELSSTAGITSTALDSIVLQDSPVVTLSHRTLDASTPPPGSTTSDSDSERPPLPASTSVDSSLAVMGHLSPEEHDFRRYTPPSGFLDPLAPPSSHLESSDQEQEDDDHEATFSQLKFENDEQAETPELFEPSFPVQTSGFILPNIEEESEESEGRMSRDLEEISSSYNDTAPFSFEDVGLEEIETSFTDRSPLAQQLQQINQTQEPSASTPINTTSRHSLTLDPPVLPLSPPPGPLLSPNMLQQLSESTLTSLDGSTLVNRQSLLDDTPPPPLPSSLPPGKLISPRHSLLLLGYGAYGADDLESTLKNADSRLDLSFLLSKLEKLSPERPAESQSIEATPVKVALNIRDENQTEGQENDDDDEPTILPPPIEVDDQDGSDVTITSSRRLRRPSSLLEPPVEFSDSGFTDTENTPRSRQRRQAGRDVLDIQDTTDLDDTTSVSTLREDTANLLQLPRHKTSFTSDDRLTDYSGSIGPKTNASSGSQPSLTTCSRDNLDDDASSVTTKVSEAKQERSDVTVRKRNSAASPHLQEICKPTIRKTGWLEVKTMLVRKNRKVAMKSKRKWKKFWATLKGSSLLLYQCDDETALSEDAHVDQILDLELGLVHAVNDHPKRDNIFCLSTNAGNSYYLQTKNQSEVDDWITTIHCAAAVAATSQAHKDEAVGILKSKTDEINMAIEKETQLKNLTELNLASANDYATKTMASKQFSDCCENIERFNIDLYRTRCYAASLQGTELPNPQTLLGSVSKQTKLALGRVGIFSVGSLHAIVSARQKLVQSASSLSLKQKGSPSSSPKTTKNYQKLPMTHKQKASSLSRVTEKPSKRSIEISGPLPLSASSTSFTFPRLPSRHFYETNEETTDAEESHCIELILDTPHWQPAFINTVSIKLPSGRHFENTLRNDMKVGDVLTLVCEKNKLSPADYFLKLTLETDDEEFEFIVPSLEELFVNLEYVQVELCQKFVHTIVLSNATTEPNNGFGLRLVPDSPTAVRSVRVADVREGGEADAQGIMKGDEVVLVNDCAITELNWDQISRALEAQTVSLTLRTCHVELPVSSHSTANQIVESLICPAPPSHDEISGDALSKLTIPLPSSEGLSRFPDHQPFTELSQDQIDTLMKDSHELSKLLRTWKMQQQQQSGSSAAPMSRDDRLRKSTKELVVTEQEYVRFLTLILERYLKPLKEESVISQEEVENLTANIPELVNFQKQFLKTLEDALTLEPEKPKAVPTGRSVLKNVVLAIAEAFRYHANDFRQYSTFCDSHHKAKRIVAAAHVKNTPLQQFLEVRNPHNDRSLRFEALLAKPILRVSKYLLFLNAILDHTPQDSEEREHLRGAIEGMIKVLDYLNEVQRLCEMYSSLFEALLKATPHTEFGVNVKICQLRHQDQVMWLNPGEDSLAKGWKKGTGPDTLCFVFRTAIILLCLDKRLRRKPSKAPREIEVTSEELRYKALLPCLQCGVHDLPDSDGVTNMLRVQFKSKPGIPAVNFLFRSQSFEKKAALLMHLRSCIKEQQALYGGFGPQRAASRSSPSLPPPLIDHPSSSSSSTLHPSHSLLRRVTSPPPSTASGYYTSETD